MSIPFSKDSYADIIKTALRAGYNCTTFKNSFLVEKPVMILRHDVDFSLNMAVELGKIEHELGVQSTYFVMLACEHYNTLSPDSREHLRQLHTLGHEVGLHWDSSTYPKTASEVEGCFKREVATLSDALGHPVTSASQHIPTDNPAYKVEAFIEHEAYADKFKDRFAYVSDSSMRWREKTPYDLIKTGTDIQFLSHPIWWVTEGDNADDILRALASEIGVEQSEKIESFINYMNKVLDNRNAYDQAFKKKRNWN